MVLYVGDIFLASSKMKLVKGTKAMLSHNFKMKDLGDTLYVLGIEIMRDS